MEGRGVGFEAPLVFQPTLDEVERDLRQPPLCHAVQIFDVDCLIDPHLAYDLPALRQRRNIAYFGITPQSPAGGMRHVHGADLAVTYILGAGEAGELWIT